MVKNEQNENENILKLKKFNEIDDTKSKNDVLIQCKISKDYDFSISCEFLDKQFTSKEFSGTGVQFEEIREIEYPFENFIVKIGLSPNNQFLGITEIKQKKDFRKYEDKISSEPFYDVDEFYPE